MSLLILSGCKGGKLPFGKDTKDPAGALEEEVYRGTKGLEMRFQKGLPPDTVFVTDELDIVIELMNRGTHDPNYGVVGDIYISGIDPSFVSGMRAEMPFGPIEPKTRFMPQGGLDSIEFGPASVWLPDGTDSIPVDLIATACYHYKTLANPVVCVDPNRENAITDKKACTPGSVSLSGGQGAPVAVSNVRAETTGKKAYFTIDISNAGGGQVIDQSTGLGMCPYSLDYTHVDKVEYTVDITGSSTKKCSPRTPVRLTNGKARITCSFDIPSQSSFAYLTPLQIELNYGYMQSISKKVKFVNIE